MTQLHTIDNLDAFIAARAAWQSIGEHVFAKKRWLATEKIGLRVINGGVGTPHFGDDEQLWLTVDGMFASQHGTTRHKPVSTLRAAAEFVNVEAGAPTSVFSPTTPLDLDANLQTDPASAAALQAWYTFADGVIADLRQLHSDDDPSLVQLWPEHFDVACDFGDASTKSRANYGASPGDGAIPTPYLYVGPWNAAERQDDPFWNESWGVALRYDELLATADPTIAAAEFFARGYAHLRTAV